MKPKTIDEVLFEAIEAAASYTHRVTADEADQIQAEALAQIQQLLEECAPEEKKFTYSDIYGDDPRNNYGYGEERYRDGATYGYAKSIDQYKSNLMGKLR